MKQVEYPFNGRYDLIHQYSDKNMKLLQVDTGEYYDDAVDAYPTDHIYEETDIPTPTIFEEIEQEEPKNE